MGKTANKIDRVPPYMPILWQDWEGDPDTSTMTDLQVGIFFKMLLRQWVVGSVPSTVNDIIRDCKLNSGRNTVLRFLEAYPHLWTCDGCGADFVRTECGCSTDAGRTSDGQTTDAKRTNGVRRAYTRRTNQKLKNLRIDVNSGLELGTTKPNQTEPKPKPEPQPNDRKPKFDLDYVPVEVEPSAPEPLSPLPFPVQPEQESVPASAMAEPTPPAAPELSDIRDWNEDRFGVPAERIQNCLIYHLDYNPKDWLRKDPPTVASMERENFVKALDKNTPPGWTPEKHKQKRTHAAATNSGTEAYAQKLLERYGGK